VNELEAENVGRQPLANRSRNRWTNGHQPSLRGVVARVDHCFDEFDAGNDFDDQFRVIEPAPVLLGFHGEFKDHDKGSDS
jgi:hypothetical protein